MGYSSSSFFNAHITRSRLLALLSLILVWSVADMLPKYKATIKAEIREQRNKLPAVKIDYHPHRDPKMKFNQTKLAILIEGRPLPHLVPQMLHMISVVPPDWRFLFLGSNKSVISVGRALATQVQQADGKLDLKQVPSKWSIDSKEGVYRMLTDKNFYNEMIPGVEWMLKFEADSIMCANSGESLNNWLEYSWAGAPRTAYDQFAGNGGLSFRRISAITQVLSFQSRFNDTEPEDEWFGKRVSVLPKALVASATQEAHFSVEDVWHEKPMGYHVPEGGTRLPEGVWKERNQRKAIFEYCPELAMIMPMKLEKERCYGDLGNARLGPGLQPASYMPQYQPQAQAADVNGAVNTFDGAAAAVLRNMALAQAQAQAQAQSQGPPTEHAPIISESAPESAPESIAEDLPEDLPE